MDINALQSMSEKMLGNTPVEVIAVTKTHPYEAVSGAYTAGLRHIGENRVEEAEGKIAKAKQQGIHDIYWHMIGHVQSRKVADVVQLFDRIDSVDSLELIQKIDAEAGKIGKTQHILLEVNISDEESKYGFRTLDALMLRRADAKNIHIDGLMTMAPFVTNPEDNRWIFKKMKELSTSLQTDVPGFGSALSMGTSGDYMVAIEEGATEVRLGSALFGERG